MDRPPLVLEDFFDGEIQGWGIQQSRFGRLRNEFEITATGTWEDGTQCLRLTEVYRFDDGFVDTLNWVIFKRSPTVYRGTESLVKGTASGEQQANWFRWRYHRKTPSSSGKATLLTFDDCFWLQNDGVLIARASVSRFGVEIATMSVFYRRP